MHRPTVGLIALVLIGAGVALRVWPQDWGAYQALLAACSRLGVVMGALWLAHAQVSRLPPTFVVAVVVCSLVVAMRPKLIVVVAPVLVALWLLRPRSKPTA